MNIAVDGGALCSPPGKQFGTYRFSTELLEALAKYGKQNYRTYTFCDVPKRIQQQNLVYETVKPSFAWMKWRLPLALASSKPDIFLGLNQVLPFGFKGRKIVFCHGLSFYFFPEYYKDDYKKLYNQLEDYLKDADIIVVSSVRVKQELLEINPEAVQKVVVLPFGIFHSDEKEKRKPHPYFLYVGSDQQIKNVSGLIHTFTEFWKRNRTSQFRLILVGTERLNLPPNIEQVSSATYEELKTLYANATAYISCSFYESFNYPIVEALNADCPVISLKSAIIPEQEPFVHIAENMEDMMFLMEKASQGAFEKEVPSALHRIFNWEHYVKDLEKLYN